MVLSVIPTALWMPVWIQAHLFYTFQNAHRILENKTTSGTGEMDQWIVHLLGKESLDPESLCKARQGSMHLWSNCSYHKTGGRKRDPHGFIGQLATHAYSTEKPKRSCFKWSGEVEDQNWPPKIILWHPRCDTHMPTLTHRDLLTQAYHKWTHNTHSFFFKEKNQITNIGYSLR